MKNKKIKILFSFLLTVALCMSSTFLSFSPTIISADLTDEIAELGEKYKELEKQQDAINAEINKAKTEKDKQLAIKSQIDKQVNLTSQQIIVLGSQINLLEGTIAEKENIISEKEKEMQTRLDTYKSRMRASYMAGEASTLELILGAESFSQFLTRTEVITRVAERDNKLLNELNELIAYINEEKTELESEILQLAGAKGELDVKKTDLNGQLQTVQLQIQDIAALEAQIVANKAQLEREMAEVQSEIDRIYATLNSDGDYDGGIMQWPVPGFPTVTSDFGWRFNNTDYHTGIDISGRNASGVGANGQNIVAAADGVVHYVQLTYVAGRGYGRYLIVDHGGGISTLYAHTSAILVNVGDTVTRGQAIARVGSTGWSTGPHLHFEVRENGKYVNPWSYLK